MIRSDFLLTILGPFFGRRPGAPSSPAPLPSPDFESTNVQRCTRCGWRRGSYHADIRGQVTKVAVKCPCDCTIVCLGCGLIDVEHWLGPWYYSEGYGRAMHKMYMVPARHRCPDGSRSPGQRHLHPWESAPGPFEPPDSFAGKRWK